MASQKKMSQKVASKSGSSAVPKRGGSARPIQNKQTGIIMGSAHGSTTQVPPKQVSGQKPTLGKVVKSTRGESPIVKSKDLLGNSAQSTGSRMQYPSGLNSGQASTKGNSQKSINLKEGGKSSNRGGVSTVGSFGAAMARNTATPSGGPLQMSIMGSNVNTNLGAPTSGQSSGPQSRHKIGFNPDRSNKGFKAGGPIRATGAAMYGRDDMIQTTSQALTPNMKTSSTPGAMASSKMPQRPGSSKPLPKGTNALLNEADQPPRVGSAKQSVNSAKHRPESPGQLIKKQYVAGQSKQRKCSSAPFNFNLTFCIYSVLLEERPSAFRKSEHSNATTESEQLIAPPAEPTETASRDLQAERQDEPGDAAPRGSGHQIAATAAWDRRQNQHCEPAKLLAGLLSFEAVVEMNSKNKS